MSIRMLPLTTLYIVLHDTIGSLKKKETEALYVVTGDFNHVNLKDRCSTSNIATRGGNTLHKVFINRRGAYRVVPRPHLGASDHISLLLASAYCPVSRSRIYTNDPQSMERHQVHH